jgi:starch phosphorylase
MQLDSFQVSPALPEKLQGLREMAYNLLWTWDDDLRAVFRRLDRVLWDQCYQNPVLLLGMISQQRLQELVKDDNFMSFYQRSYSACRSTSRSPPGGTSATRQAAHRLLLG